MYSTSFGWLLLGMLIQRLLTLLTDGKVSLDQLLVELVGNRHWTINWDHIPKISNACFIWKQYLRLSTSTSTTYRSRNQPFPGSVRNGDSSGVSSTRTTDSAMANLLHTLSTSVNLWKWRYRSISNAWAKLFRSPLIQGLQRNNSIMESTGTRWIFTTSKRVRVLTSDGWPRKRNVNSSHSRTRHNKLTQVESLRIRLLTKHSDLTLQHVGLQKTEEMDTDTIVYNNNRSISQVRIVGQNSRNTNELQMYLPRKVMEKELTASQFMNLVEQILTYTGATMATGDKHKLQVALEYTLKENIVQASINGGFSTKSILHLKIRIEPVGVSTNGTIPHTIPFVMRVPVKLNTVTSAIGAGSSSGSTGQSMAQTIVNSFKSLDVTSKNKSDRKKQNRAKNRSEAERKEDEKRKKQAKQNYLARQGIVETGTKDLNILVITGPSIQYGNESRSLLDTLLTSTMNAPKTYVAKLVGINKDMLHALGDVLNLAKQAFENLLFTLLDDEHDLWDDICSRLYYQFHELRHGNEKLESIYVVYLAHNENDRETERRVDYLENILSAHYEGDQFVYKKGLKFLIRRYRAHSKERTSTEVQRARRTVANATIEPPFMLIIDSLKTTPQYAMERIIYLFNQAAIMNPRAANATCFIEHIGPTTDNSGVYLSFTQHLMASKVLRLFQQHPRALKELFHTLYGVKQFFGATGTFSREALYDEYSTFFTAIGRPIPKPRWTDSINKFDISATIIQRASTRTATSYSAITEGGKSNGTESTSSDEDIDNSSSSKRMKTGDRPTNEEKMETSTELDLYFDDTQSTSTPPENLVQMGKRKQPSTKEVMDKTLDSGHMEEGSETQSTMVNAENMPTMKLSTYLRTAASWKKQKNHEYSHNGGKVFINFAKDYTRFFFDKLSPVQPIKTMANDCGAWCLSKLLQLTNPLDLSPVWSHEGITQEELIFIMKQDARLANMDATQITSLRDKFRKMAICLTMDNGFFGESINLTLNDALTGDLIIDYLDLQFGLLQKDNGQIELIALKEGLTVLNCMDSDYHLQGYLPLFSNSHMQLVYFEPYRKILEETFNKISSSEGERKYPFYTDIDTNIRRSHYGADSTNSKESKDSNEKAKGHQSIFFTDEQWNDLFNNQKTPAGGIAVPAPVINKETLRAYITKKQWGEILKGRTVDDLGRPIKESVKEKLTGIKRSRESSTEYKPTWSSNPIVEIKNPMNVIAATDSDKEDDEYDSSQRKGLRMALFNQINETEEWRGHNDIFQHIKNHLILQLQPARHSKRIRILLQHVQPIPEYSTIPNDCAWWHLSQYLKFMKGLPTAEWEPTPLTHHELDCLGWHHAEITNGRPTKFDKELDECLRKYSRCLTFPECNTMPTLKEAPTIKMILRLAQPDYILYQLDDDIVELFSVNPNTTFTDLTRNTFNQPTHLFLFQPGHVRLVPWQSYRYSLSKIMKGNMMCDAELFLYHIKQRRITLSRHVGSTNHGNDVPVSSTDRPTLASTADQNSIVGVQAQENTNDHHLFPMFRQRTSSSNQVSTTNSDQENNAFTTGQFQKLVLERALDGKHLPYLWTTPATTFRRIQLPNDTDVQSTETLSPDSNGHRRSKRTRRRTRISQATLELDLMILEYYIKHYGGRTDLKVNDIKKLGSGLFALGALHTTDFIPLVGKFQQTCSANQLRRLGGVNVLQDRTGYLIESLEYDIGYGEVAKRKNIKAVNFARCIRLVSLSDARVNMKLDHTSQGSLIIRPTRLILGHPQRPVELFLGHPDIPESAVDNSTERNSSATKKPAPVFRPTGKRQDPKINGPEHTVNNIAEQPGTVEDLDDVELGPNTPCFGSASSNPDCTKACLNMKGNGTSVPLLTEVVKFFREQKIDILGLMDTGIVSREIARTVYKRFFGSAHIYIIPAKVPRLSTGRKQKAIGGMIIIINEQHIRVERHLKDPSELGIFHTVRLKVRNSTVDVMFLYWPTTHRENISDDAVGYQDGLAVKLLDYLRQNNIHLSPDEWIQAQIRNRCPQLHMQDSRHFFLLGDMNRLYNINEMETEGTLAHLVTQLGLTTSLKHLLDSKGLSCNSFFRGDQESELDHIFTSMPMDLITLAGRGTRARWCALGYTDHVIIWMGFSLRNILPMADITPETSLILGALAKIEKDDDNTRNNIQAALKDWWERQEVSNQDARRQFYEESSVETLGQSSENISRQMAQVVIDALNKPNRRHKSRGIRVSHLWSPRLSSIIKHYEILDDIIDTLQKPKDLGQQLRSCRRTIDYWLNKMNVRKRATPAYDYKPEDEGCTNVDEWITYFDRASIIVDFDQKQRERRNLLQIATTDKKTLGEKIHARNRKEFATTIGGHLSKREAVLVDKHLKRAFASLTETSKAAYNFAELSEPDGTITTDQYEIHDKVTNFFLEDIFKNPAEALPTKFQLEQDNLGSLPTWQRMLEDEDFFQEIFHSSDLPADVIELISKAFCNTTENHEKRAAAKTHVLKALTEPFTFSEFSRMIKRARGSSAGGITGLSYGILKLAPYELLEHLFSICSKMWEQRYIPPYWKVKYLHLLVKDLSKTGLNNLRPIGLIEVLRKIWGNLIIHRIRCALHESKFLATTQYGFISKKGTTDELIQLTNVLEEASESNKHVEMTTWDISKAFDSVGRNIQFITWLRMGVPIDVAKWFVDLDNGGYFIVRSPYALHHMRTLHHPTAPAQVMDLAEQLGFQAERGYTQGDVLSTTGWVGFFDILLTALDLSPDIGKFYYRSEGPELYAQDAMAYADDLVTITANREQTDAYSKIICAFMALFGLKLAPNKIRSTTTVSPPGVLTYYDWNWSSHTRLFGDANTPITILGVIMTASGTWDHQYEYLLLHCQRITQTVGHKLASLSLKAKLLLASTLAQILYRTQVIALLPTQLDQLNRILFKVLRDFKNIGLTFPTQALITKHLGGIFTDVQSATTKRKWSLQGRMLAIGGAQGTAMQSLLHRMHRRGFNDFSPSGQTAFIKLPKAGALPRWGDDLPRSLREGLGLKYFGYDQHPSNPVLSHMDPPPTVACAEVLEELSVYYRCELTPDGTNVPAWLKPQSMPEFRAGMRTLLNSNLIREPVGPPTGEPCCTLAPDQLYTFLGEEYEQSFFEISGILPTGIIAGRRWSRINTHSKKLVPTRAQNSHGRAYQDRWDPFMIPLTNSRRALAYSPHNQDEEMILLGTHQNLRGELPPSYKHIIPEWCQNIILDTAATLGVTSTMVSDASYKRHTDTIHALFRTQAALPTHAGGAFVLFKPGSNTPTLGVIVTGMETLDNYNNFVGELFTGLAQEQLRSCLPGRIAAFLDCDSVLGATEQRLPATSEYYVNLQEDYGTVLQQFHRLRRTTSHPPIQWTRGHPDRDVHRKNGRIDHAIPRREWGQAEYGIYIADHLADFTDTVRSTLIFEGLLPEKIVEVSIKEVLEAIPDRGQWLRCPLSTPQLPLLTPQRELADDKIYSDYCLSRDQSSTRPARWTIIQPGQLRPALKVLGALGWASNWANYMRIILDKLPHGRNVNKGYLGPIAPCPICLKGEDSLEHLTRCEGNSIRTSRDYFHYLLLHDIRDYCTRQRFAPATVLYSLAYAKACASTLLSELDAIGGWTGIPTPRFLYFYQPDLTISEKVGRELRQVLPRIIAENIKWLKRAWRLRCSIAHGTSATGDSQSTRSNTTLQLTSFHRMAQGQNTHRTQDSNVSSQTSLIPHLTPELNLTPVEFGLLEYDNMETSASDRSTDNLVFNNETTEATSDEVNISQSPTDLANDEIGTEGASPDMTTISSPLVNTRPLRFRVTNYRGTLINGEPLLYDLSEEAAFPEGRNWTDLLPSNYHSLWNDIGILLPPPVEIRIGPSRIPGAGLGLFVYTGPMTIYEGTAACRYWGPSTRNSGIPSEYAPEDSIVPPGTRDDGAYLLRHGNYLVDADEDCSMGYANEGWREANCFFQHTSEDEPELLLILKQRLLPYRVYELTVNYGQEYWSLGPHPRLDSLNAAARRLFQDYYGG